MDDLIGSGLETIVLDDISLNQPVATLMALAAIPTTDLNIGCNVWVVSAHRYYEWGGSSWSPSTVPYDLNILSTQGIIGSDLMYRQSGSTLYKNTIDQLATYVNPNVIIYYDAEVDGVGTAPNTFATWSAACTAGNKSIKTTASFTEIATVTPPEGCYIYIEPGVRVNLGAHPIDVGAIDNLTIQGFNRLSSTIAYTRTTSGNVFINDGAGSLTIVLKGLGFDFTGCVGSDIEVDVNSVTSPATMQTENIAIFAGNDGSFSAIAYNTTDSYFNNLAVVGSGSSSYVNVWMDQAALGNGLEIRGTFGAGLFILTPQNGSKVDGISVILDSPPASGDGVQFSPQNGSSISNCYANSDTAVHIQISGTVGFYSLSNFNTIDYIVNDDVNDGQISGCTALLYDYSGGSIARRYGNNDIIGNDYSEAITPIDYYDAYVDGVGVAANSYVNVGAAVSAGKVRINNISSGPETGDIAFVGACYVYVQPSSEINLGNHSFDFAGGGAVIESLDGISATIGSTQSSGNAIFKNLAGNTTYLTLINIGVDVTGVTNGTFNTPGDQATIRLDGVNFVTLNTDLGVCVDSSTNNGSYVRNSKILGFGTAAPVIIATGGSVIDTVTYAGSFGSGAQALILENSKASKLSFLNSGNLVITTEGSILDAVDGASTYYILSSGVGGSIISSAKGCTAMVNGTAYSNTLMGCSAASYTPSSGVPDIRVGNNDVIGNDYLTEELPYWGQYNAFAGPGQTYTTVTDALASGAAGVMVTGNTAEPSNWLITQNTNILILNGTVDMAQFKIDRSAANGATVNVLGIGPSSVWAWEPNGSSSSTTYMNINQNSSSITNVKNLSIPISLYDPAGTSVVDFADTGTVQFDAVQMTCPEANFILSLNTKDGYFKNSNCTGPSALANFALAGGGNTLNANAVDNVKFDGHFYLLSLGNGTTGHTFSNIKFNVTMDTNVTFDAPNNILKNITSNHTYDVRCLSDDCVLTILNCPQIGTLSGTYRDTTFASTIIGSSAATNTCTIYSGLAAPYRAANNGTIGNDYLTSVPAFYGPYATIVGPGQAYTTVADAITAGAQGILVVGNTTEVANWDISQDVWIYIMTGTVAMGAYQIDMTAAPASTVSVSGQAYVGVWAWSPIGDAGGPAYLCINDTTSTNVLVTEVDVTVTLSDPTSIYSVQSCAYGNGNWGIDNINLTCPETIFTVNLNSTNSYLTNSNITGPSALASFYIGGSGFSGVYADNLEFSGDFYAISMGFAGSLTNIHVAYNATITTVISIDSGFTLISNIASQGTPYNISVSAGGDSFNIVNCPNIGTISGTLSDLSFVSTIIGCSAVTNSMVLGLGAALPYRAGNNAVIGNDYTALGATGNSPGYNAMIEPVNNITVALVPYAGCSGTILGLGEKAASLTTAGTLSIDINGTPVTGLTAVVPSTAGSYTAATAANTFVRGDVISVTYTGTLLITYHSLLLDFTQTS